jgi:hypothetical protein
VVILWVAVSLIFGIIFTVWLTTFDLSFSLPEDNVEAVEQMSPFESLKGMLSEVGADIGRGYDVLLESIEGNE